MTKPMTIDGPTCGTAVQGDTTNAFRPFCSDRCKLIDLGA
ncbi:MAG: DNA gyrase inhibitor YacG, partial [Pseudomonas sp.]|nr:DNA gyrase inhibitor YacG [Pseudomonas sp.]